MRRLAARRTGGPPDNKPGTGRRTVALLAGGLVAALLVVATVVWWPQDRPATPPTSVSTPRASRPPADPAALQKQLDGVVEAGAPGVVGLVRTGERNWQGASGLGDLRGNRPARAGDRFRIGSVTKSFVATVMLQLVGEGRLRLDDNLERWLPGLVPGGEKITARQLLNHTSGLYNYTDDLPEPPRRFRPRELVAIATGHKPLFAPGTQFSYSNTNYILAGMLVERVTGQATCRPAPAAHPPAPGTWRHRAAHHPADTCRPAHPGLCASRRGLAGERRPGPAGRRHRDGHLLGVGGRRDGVHHRRSGPLLPGPAGRPAPHPGAAEADADHGGCQPGWGMEPATDSGWRCCGRDAGWSCGATAGRWRAMGRRPSAPLTPTASWSWRSTCNPSQSPGQPRQPWRTSFAERSAARPGPRRPVPPACPIAVCQ